MRINQNIASMNANRNLSQTSNRLGKSLEKLSSGFRINRAGDDAAGLVISENLRSQVGGLKVATRNAQDGISVVQTAEGALTEVHSMLQRARDLAVQASNTGANGGHTGSSVAAAQAELDELVGAIEQIADTTKFNGTSLMNSTNSLTFQVGANGGETVAITLADMQTAALGIDTLVSGQAGDFDSGAGAARAAIATIDGVLVERSHEFGIFVGGSEATITRSVVRDIAARPADGGGGVGIAVQRSFETGGGATATVADTTVERCQQSGLSVLGATASFESVVVRDALPDENGAFGDGLVASLLLFEGLGDFPTTVTMTSSRIENSPRAGVLAFAADVSLADTHLSCNDFHLNGEVFEHHDFVIVDEGGNSCGCGDTVETCKVLSSGLDVPAAIP